MSLEIRLPENPSAGYRWEVVSGQFHGDDFTLWHEAYEPAPSDDPDVVGDGGMRSFMFPPGTFTLVYRRSWLRVNSEIFRITVEVHPTPR